MTEVVIPKDEELDVGAVTLEFKKGVVEISQDNDRAFPPTLYLTNTQAEQLRDYLNNLFEVEK